MGKFVKGDVVVIRFPFSDPDSAKKRPAFVIDILSDDDLILCQITSNALEDGYAIEITDDDFENGGLMVPGNVRLNKLFTVDKRAVLYKVGTLKELETQQIIDCLLNLFGG
ncbi:MAG: type II toxin-antitoxin system PemK/MazF family toxin [Firmicutes bacterium]|nr:type II toxin-antitoxin system PemK/MazF family toxin [Bacillota bacterium]